MMNRNWKMIVVGLLIAMQAHLAQAEEGMWLPILLKQLNYEDMREKGFQLDANDIYSINQACLKDAVMLFGRGCTAEMISKDGLILTNHHCGFGQIQSHSSLENDYLTDGFWAKSRKEELVNDDLTVTFLREMSEVTAFLNKGIKEGMSKVKRQKIFENNKKNLLKEASRKREGWTARVVSFFEGNVYYLLYEETFKDVRLVGAPPSAIGKFGGDTDNWMWPRHGGDFALFRIYADSNNKPAKYTATNTPYRAPKFIPISLKGIEEGDFTFVLGFPFSTQSYAPSHHLEMLMETTYPVLVDVRTAKLDVIKAGMERSPKVRIQYAAKAASISNAWKKWKGEIKGLEKLNAIHKKRAFETEFQKWADQQGKYQDILANYDKIYPQYKELRLTRSVYSELTGSYGLEYVNFIYKLRSLLQKKQDGQVTWEALKKDVSAFYKNYDRELDMDLCRALLAVYKEKLEAKAIAPLVRDADISVLVGKVYASSLSRETGAEWLDAYQDKPKELIELLEAEDAYVLRKALDEHYKEVLEGEKRYRNLLQELALLNQDYMEGIMAFRAGEKIYPDANQTLRLSYGQVAGYQAKDGVYYKHETTLKGVMEKDNPEIYDYQVPTKLKDLYARKDFGEYVNKDGEVPVCFIATNHTTGGNSGSPVMNAKGELIGLNFDRAWDGVMSDLMYNPAQCRNISVDIRYILFIIDKLGGAGYLLDEMNLVR